MKIYTYYENINFKNQDQLVEIWEKSWSSNGFDPVVLSLEDAKKSPFYEEFVEKIKFLVPQITNEPLSMYGLSCYLRWLAYSIQADTDSFLVSDYDVINMRFTPAQMFETKEKISFMDRMCPCLAYGNKEQFLSFCKDIISFTSVNLEEIKLDYIKNKYVCYHDQDFLVLNKNRLENYNICPARKYVMPYIHNDLKMKDCGIIHFSHTSVEKTQESFPKLKEIKSDELRIKLIKELKNNTINYLTHLRSFRSAGGGSTNQESTEFNDIGLKLALVNAKEFFPSFQQFLKIINFDSFVIEKLDITAPVNQVGESFKRNKSDKAGPNHRYDLIYQPIFNELGFDKKLNILEIGLGTNNVEFVSHMGREARPGSSLYAYKELFSNAKIYGADVDKEILFEEDRIKTSFVDQLDFSTFRTMHNNFNNPEYDILIEDGLHSITASLNTLIFGLQTVKNGGYLVLEDLYNPNSIWNFLAQVLLNSKTIQSARLVNSGGLMLVIKK